MSGSCLPNTIFGHAASAFFPSPFEEAVVLTIDGVGELGDDHRRDWPRQ